MFRQAQRIADFAVEFWWRTSIAMPRPNELTWPVDEEILRDVIITWPTRYQWPDADKWVCHIRDGLSRLVRVRIDDVEQSYPGIVMIHVTYRSNKFNVAIDYRDHSTVSPQAAARAAVYFKMQHSVNGYSNKKVIPGGFIPAGTIIYSALPYLRKIVAEDRHRFDVYGRFGNQFATSIRADAVKRLTEQRSFRYEGGMTTIRYSRYLRDIASAKVCIDLPGNGDLCFRMIDYMAVGACVIGLKPRNVLHVPLTDRLNVVYAKDDLSDLVDLCQYYVSNDEERRAVAYNSAMFFDRYLSQWQLGSYYLSNIIKYS